MKAKSMAKDGFATAIPVCTDSNPVSSNAVTASSSVHVVGARPTVVG